MRGFQESTGRRTVLWPKRTAREKQTRHRTVAEGRGVKKTRHIIKKELVLTILEKNLRVNKERYRVSLLAPVIGMSLKDVHCLSTVLVPADVSGSTCPLLYYSVFFSFPLQSGAHANVERSSKHLSCSESLSSPLDLGLICDYALIINDLPVLRFCADLKPLQLNYIGDINT